MSDLNCFNVIGRLTKDAVLKTLPNGTQLLEFSIANNRGFGDYAKCYFFDVKMFGKGAPAVAQFMKKGKQVAVNGEMTIESWSDAAGMKKSKPVMVTFDVSLLSDGGAPKQEAPPVDHSNEELLGVI